MYWQVQYIRITNVYILCTIFIEFIKLYIFVSADSNAYKIMTFDFWSINYWCTRFLFIYYFVSYKLFITFGGFTAFLDIILLSYIELLHYRHINLQKFTFFIKYLKLMSVSVSLIWILFKSRCNYCMQTRAFDTITITLIGQFQCSQFSIRQIQPPLQKLYSNKTPFQEKRCTVQTKS